MAAGRAMGHFVTRFPSVSETFVVGDMMAMTTIWPEAHVFAFFKEKGTVPDWIRQVHYFPVWALYPVSQLRFLLTRPLRYLKLFKTVVTGHWSKKSELLKAMITWPKMVHAAHVVDREGIEPIHAHWSNIPATTTYVVAKLLDIKFSCTGHAHDLFKFNAFLPEILKSVDLFITSSEYARNQLLETYPFVPPDKIQVYSHGVNLNLFTPAPPLSVPPLVLTTIGRMTWQKGFPTLLRAMALLRDWEIPVRLNFLALSGHTETEVRGIYTELNLKDVVEWIDPLPAERIVDIYHAAHVFVLPCEIGPHGDRDGIPNVILEAMACGLPCVSTPIAGVPEVVRHEQTGLLVEPANPEALAEAIKRLYENQQLRLALGQGARKLIEKQYDRVVCHRRITELMESVHG